jgi:KamA family protein
LSLFGRQCYEAITRTNIHKYPEWNKIGSELREATQIVSSVLPFRTNTYVTQNLIDWSKVPDDPIYQLTFPQKEMLDSDDYVTIRDAFRDGTSRGEIAASAREIQMRLNPHPAGQITDNLPEMDGCRLSGIQHKYREAVLFFPAHGQTCHAYCTYCFRWPQFVSLPGMKFQARDSSDLVAYLRTQPEVTDLLVTGGDPLVMKSRVLEGYLKPLLHQDMGHIQTIRIGTKALAYWPYRFLSDPDADALLHFFEEIVRAGKHLAVLAHFSHPVEMRTEAAQKAIRRVRSTGAEIRMQAPLVRHVNDEATIWTELWRLGVRHGMVPYYMFVIRNTGPAHYFEVSLHRAGQIFREAYRSVSGLARTVRGPCMSAFPGKVNVVGTSQIGREKVFVLEFLQARNPDWVRRPFYAQFDPDSCWFDQLRPAFGKQHFFFERNQDPWAVSTVA